MAGQRELDSGHRGCRNVVFPKQECLSKGHWCLGHPWLFLYGVVMGLRSSSLSGLGVTAAQSYFFLPSTFKPNLSMGSNSDRCLG